MFLPNQHDSFMTVGTLSFSPVLSELDYTFWNIEDAQQTFIE